MAEQYTSTSILLGKVYQQLSDAGSIQCSQLLKIVQNDKVAAQALYNDLKKASIVQPLGDTEATGEVPPALSLTDSGMAFLISKGYAVRP